MPLLVAAALCISLRANADSVTDWNLTMDQNAPALGGPPQQAYLGAVTHIAIHDALNSIQRRYATYSVVPAASASANPDAAVAAAAHDVLIAQFSRAPETPAKATARANVQAAYLARLAVIADSSAKQQGVAAGQAAAAAILQLRSNDGFDTPNLPYLLGPGVGVHQPTAPNFPAPQYAGWAKMKPFGLTKPSQFRVEPSPLFNLRGLLYTLQYLEVKIFGDAYERGSKPDSEMSDIARFWPGGGGNWNNSMRSIVDGLGMDRWQHARLFALSLLAQTDASIAVFDSKYTYNFWRPSTAIRWSNDGNPLTPSDPNWLPFLVTPPYPDYPCGLTGASGSATEVLRRFFGTDRVDYTVTANAPPVTLPAPLAPLPAKAITRHFDTLSDATAESVSARVYGGMHFRQGCARGVVLGTQVGRYVFQTQLRPVKH